MADLGHEPSIDPPTPYDALDQDRYRVVDEFPYLDREDEYDGLTLDEAAAQVEDLVDYPADEVLANVGEGILPLEVKDDETGRIVTLTKAVS